MKTIELLARTADFVLVAENGEWLLYGPWGVIRGEDLEDALQEAVACSPPFTQRQSSRKNSRVVWPLPAAKDPDEAVEGGPS